MDSYYNMNQLSLNISTAYEPNLNHPAHYINQLVEGLDLPKDNLMGRPREYDLRMLLKLVLLAYSYGIFSCRKIERFAKENIVAMWLTQEQQPTIKTTTDDTGNKPIQQTIKYKAIDNFNQNSYEKVYNRAMFNDPKVKDFIFRMSKVKKKAEKDHDAAFAEIAKPINEASREVLNTFTSDYFDKATKGLVKPFTFADEIDLGEPTSQQIYNKRYIGYKLNDSDGYLLTIAQSKKQTATLEK